MFPDGAILYLRGVTVSKFLTSLFLLGALIVPSSCQAADYADDVAKLVTQTAYIKFTPALDELELPAQVIGSAWAVKTGGDYRIVTAQHVVLGVALVPGVLQVCSWKHNCINLVVTEGVGPVLGSKVSQDWIY